MNMNDAHAQDHHHPNGDRGHIDLGERREILLTHWTAYKRGWCDGAIMIGAVAFALGILVCAAAVRLGLSL